MTPQLLLVRGSGESTGGGDPHPASAQQDAESPMTWLPAARGALQSTDTATATYTRSGGTSSEGGDASSLLAQYTPARGTLRSARIANDTYTRIGVGVADGVGRGDMDLKRSPYYFGGVRSSAGSEGRASLEGEEWEGIASSEFGRRPSRARGVFTAASAALKDVALSPGEADEATWLEAAQRLRRAAVVGRDRAPRHAALALILGDALTFTRAASLSQGWRSPLLAGLSTLQSPFVSADAERNLVRALLRAGWKLTAPLDEGVLREIARRRS